MRPEGYVTPSASILGHGFHGNRSTCRDVLFLHGFACATRGRQLPDLLFKDCQAEALIPLTVLSISGDAGPRLPLILGLMPIRPRHAVMPHLRKPR